jgi:AraC family ethanolamine operon transcriptional activator
MRNTRTASQADTAADRSVEPAPGQIWQFDAESPREAEKAASPLEVHYFQLGPGRFRERANGVFLDHALVTRSRLDTAVRFRGAVIPNTLAFQAFHSVAPILKSPLSLGADYFAISRAADPLDLASQAAVQALSVFVPEERWTDVVDRLGAEAIIGFGHRLAAVRVDPARLARFARRISWVLDAATVYPDCFQQTTVRTVAEIGLICAVVELLSGRIQPLEHPGSAARRDQAVRNVEAYVSQHYAQPITLLDLCQIGRLQIRTLQYAFGEKYGVSPMAYLKLVRLDRARRLLQSADPRVTRVSDAALQAGFWHFSQFAQDYRRMFGESPSRTLRASTVSEHTDGRQRM